MSLTAFDAKEQVRQASDIVAVVGSYLELRRQGRLFVARCPWHDDSRPSLQINPDRQSWKCWVCDIGGDVFNFIMRREGIDFLEALEMLADKAGIPLKQIKQQAPVEPGSASDKKTLYAAMAWAEQLFHRFLLEAEIAAPRASIWPIAKSRARASTNTTSASRPKNSSGSLNGRGKRDSTRKCSKPSASWGSATRVDCRMISFAGE